MTAIVTLILVLLLAGVVLALIPLETRIRNLALKAIAAIIIVVLIVWVARMFALVH